MPLTKTEKYLRDIEGHLSAITDAQTMMERVSSLDDTALVTAMIEAVGSPVYLSAAADFTEYSAFGISTPGWYVFARIKAKGDVVVSASTAITGAAGYIATVGAAYVDVAVRFEVASESVAVTVDWDGTDQEVFVFKATDLAVRNLDYRVTFYVYDIAPFATWTYALTTDTAFAADKYYYTEANGVYTLADPITDYPETTYHAPIVSYALTTDTKFKEGKTYYTHDTELDVYTEATVEVDESVAASTYYERSVTYPVPVYYTATESYALTTDETFVEDKDYYTYDDELEEYMLSSTTAGMSVPEDTYYERSVTYTQATGSFENNVDYYIKSGNEYLIATVTTGEAIPAYYVHSAVTFEGMTRNITYVCNTPIDCPVTFNLPTIEDETHGAWFEIRLYLTGSYSSTLVVPEGVKVATEHTQPETKGFNTVDLHYSSIAGYKAWRFLNTHSTLPA